MSTSPFFTVFVPTYNRGYCIREALLSCERSTFRDFEIVVIDDGSSDDTASVVESVRAELSVPLRYAYQQNQGKHVAFNHAVALAEGVLFVTLDSDDHLLENGLHEIFDAWQSIPEEERKGLASIEFRCLEEGVAPTELYDEPYFDATYAQRNAIHAASGEKRSAYRVAVLREYPYPVFEGERYCRPGLIDLRIAKRYRTRFTNLMAIDAGHYPDGIGANRRRVIASAPNAYRQYFLEAITGEWEYLDRRTRRSYCLRYSRSSFNAGYGALWQFREMPSKLLLMSVLPESFLASVWDRWRGA